jgi:prolycopene isomerase
VRTEDGRAIRADVVVSNVDARQLFEDLLPDEVCSQERSQIGNLRVAPSYYGLYLAVPSELNLARLPRGFYYLPAEEEGKAIEWIYLSVPTRYDPDLARSGQQIITMTVGVRNSAAEYSAWQDDKSQMSEHIVQYLDRRVPGLRQNIDLMDSASPRTIARYIRSKDGAAYGWAVLPDQSGAARFPPRTSLGGLYLAGQWTSPGPGVAAVAASGWATATLISGDI